LELRIRNTKGRLVKTTANKDITNKTLDDDVSHKNSEEKSHETPKKKSRNEQDETQNVEENPVESKKRKRSLSANIVPLPQELLTAVAKHDEQQAKQEEEQRIINNKEEGTILEEQNITPKKKKQKIMHGGNVSVKVLSSVEDNTQIPPVVTAFLRKHFWSERIPRMNANLYFSQRRTGPALQFVVQT